MTLPILYSFRRCPYAMRARMALILASKECELREILLKNKPDQMLQVSSKDLLIVEVLFLSFLNLILTLVHNTFHLNLLH